MRARLAWLLAIFSFCGLTATASDQVSPTVGIQVSGTTVYSHGTLTYYCGTFFSQCSVDVDHELRDIVAGAIGYLATKYVSSGATVKVYDDTLTWYGSAGHCYQAEMSGVGSEGGNQRVSSATPCIPYNPPPPPILTTCDPGHPGCGGNGTSEEPLILDLNGDGIHTTGLETAPVSFDMNGDGRPDLTAWTDSQTEEGLLFYDRNHNHVVDGNEELFGNRTPLADGTMAATGVDALAAYDRDGNGGNHDGVIEPGDGVWGILRLWVDRNHDGVATESETYALGQLGIVAIDLDFARLGSEQSFGADPSGNFHVLQGHFRQRLRGGREVVARDIHDVFFRVTYQFE